METIEPVLPILLLAVCVAAFTVILLALGNLFNPRRSTPVKQMPYESGMDPIHDTRRRFDVRFYLLAVAFLVFDVELLFLYPWAVAAGPVNIAAAASDAAEKGIGDSGLGIGEGAGRVSSNPQSPILDRFALESPAKAAWVENRRLVFAGVMVFVALLAIGFVYDWRKGVFEWRQTCPTT